jgi:hypothetical protein
MGRSAAVSQAAREIGNQLVGFDHLVLETAGRQPATPISGQDHQLHIDRNGARLWDALALLDPFLAIGEPGGQRYEQVLRDRDPDALVGLQLLL